MNARGLGRSASWPFGTAAKMVNDLASILIGTAGLSVAALVALGLAAVRGVRQAAVPAVMRWTLVGVLVHAGHFTEETLTDFHLRFPALLGLSPWPFEFFVTFNLIWMAIWLACVPILGRLPRLAGFPIWFLAIASSANGVFHPLLAAAAGGYFPGLWTSPLAGAVGIILLRQLFAGQRRATGTAELQRHG